MLKEDPMKFDRFRYPTKVTAQMITDVYVCVYVCYRNRKYMNMCTFERTTV